MSLRDHVVAQFKRPHGLLGHLAGLIMATRSSNRRRNQWTVQLLECRPEDRVLEIGCGPGVALEACLSVLSHGHATGIDHSETMITQSHNRLQWAIREGRLDLREGGLEALSQLNQNYDRVFSVNVVQFFDDVDTAFAALFAVLKPGGRIATTYMPRHRHPTREDALRLADHVEESMKNVGFTNIRTAELSLKPVPAICVLGERLISPH